MSDKPRRSFTISNEAWYGNKADLPEVMFGMYYEDCGTDGEMGMRWHAIQDDSVPRLEVFCDAWAVLNTFDDVLRKLALYDDMNITVDKFVEILTSCGFVDDTAYESPYAQKEE